MASRRPSSVKKRTGSAWSITLSSTARSSWSASETSTVLTGLSSGQAVCGVVLHFIGVIFPIGFIGFYIYALIQLPSSQQEMLFAQTAEGDLAKHPGAVRKRKSADFTVNREKQSNKEAD